MELVYRECQTTALPSACQTTEATPPANLFDRYFPFVTNPRKSALPKTPDFPKCRRSAIRENQVETTSRECATRKTQEHGKPRKCAIRQIQEPTKWRKPAIRKIPDGANCRKSAPVVASVSPQCTGGNDSHRGETIRPITDSFSSPTDREIHFAREARWESAAAAPPGPSKAASAGPSPPR